MTKLAKRLNGSDMLNEKQAAEFVGLSVSWLRQARTKTPSWAGPIFVKVEGYRIRYRRRDLVKFLKTRADATCVINPADRMAS